MHYKQGIGARAAGAEVKNTAPAPADLSAFHYQNSQKSVENNKVLLERPSTAFHTKDYWQNYMAME